MWCIADNVTRNDSGVVICSLHAAARAQALPSPGFDLYVGVRVATEEELAGAQEAAPGEVGGSANASAPAPAPQAGLGNLDAALVCSFRPCTGHACCKPFSQPSRGE